MVLQFSSNLQARDNPSSHEFRAVFVLWSLLFTQLYGMCPRDGLLCNSVIYRSQSKETEPPTLSMSNKPFTLPEPRLMTSSYSLSPVPNPGASQVALVVKNLPISAGDLKDAGSILGSGRSPGGGHGNPLQYSCLENPMDRGAWQATVHGVAKN